MFLSCRAIALKIVARLAIKLYLTCASLNTGHFCALVDVSLELNTCVTFYSEKWTRRNLDQPLQIAKLFVMDRSWYI